MGKNRSRAERDFFIVALKEEAREALWFLGGTQHDFYKGAFAAFRVLPCSGPCRSASQPLPR
jgi:hypothetical protein